MALIIDIETTSWFKSDEHKELTIRENQHKGLKDPEKIAENHRKIIQGAALSPYTGQITCIGLRWTSVGETIIHANNYSKAEDALLFTYANEKNLLKAVWDTILKNEEDRLVSWYGKGFDLPYMFIRSLINEVNPGIDYMQFIHPYQHDIHLDIKSLFDKGSLKEVAYVLDCRTENETDGSELPELWWKDPDAVINKCKSDLIQTEQIYERVKLWIPQRLQMSSSSKTDITI